MPSILCAPVGPPDSTADSAGSTPTIFGFASCSRSRYDMPRNDAAVPTLCTKPSKRPHGCAQISSAIFV